MINIDDFMIKSRVSVGKRISNSKLKRLSLSRIFISFCYHYRVKQIYFIYIMKEDISWKKF